jgi:hypothetical protein
MSGYQQSALMKTKPEKAKIQNTQLKINIYQPMNSF